jgi:hypothetical protein
MAVLFGSYTLPYVLSIDRAQERSVVTKVLPGRNYAYRKDTAGLGAVFSLKGEIRPSSAATEDEIIALADGTPRILDFGYAEYAALEAVWNYQTGPTWTDDTVEAKSAGGTPFNLLAASTDYIYFGHREKFNAIVFDLQTMGDYGARTWEYSAGDGVWTAFSPTADGTSGFTKDGTVTFAPPALWKTDTVNTTDDKFWIRVSVASKATTATVNQISVNLVYYCIMISPAFNRDVETTYGTPYSASFQQKEDP